MVAQATPTVDDARGENGPDPAHPYVEALTGLPGVEHVAVVDVSGQHVLGEWGGPPGSADALLDRARAAADRTGRRELEDVVSTTPSAIHLSRLVLANPGHPESVWVGLRIDRAQGNLAWSRAALAGLDHPAGLPRIPVPRAAPDRTAPPPPHTGAVVPGPQVVPPPPARTPSAVPPVAPPPPAPPAPRAHVTLTARSAPPPVAPERTDVAPSVEAPDVAAAPGAVEFPVAAHVTTPVESAETTETAIPEVATTIELASPAVPPVPEPAPEPAAGPTRRSSFAPVMVVAAPPAPIPDDGSFEEPAPMPAPIVYAPDPAAPAPVISAPVASAPVDEEHAAEDAVDAAVSEDPPAPEAAAAHPDEPRIARRLFHGLRRRG